MRNSENIREEDGELDEEGLRRMRLVEQYFERQERDSVARGSE